MQKIMTNEDDMQTYAQSLDKIAEAANRAADAIERVCSALDALEGRQFGSINITAVGELASIEVKPN